MAGFNFRNVGFVGLLAQPAALNYAANIGNRATLAIAGTVALGATFRVKTRFKLVTSGNQYVIDLGSNYFSLLYNFVANCVEIYINDTSNSTGVTQRLAAAPTNDGQYHTYEFSYDGTTLSAYTDGSLTASKTVSFSMLPKAVGGFYINPGSNSTSLCDYYLLESAGATLINLDFNELSGPATNYGSLGGQMSFTGDGGKREIA